MNSKFKPCVVHVSCSLTPVQFFFFSVKGTLLKAAVCEANVHTCLFCWPSAFISFWLKVAYIKLHKAYSQASLLPAAMTQSGTLEKLTLALHQRWTKPSFARKLHIMLPCTWLGNAGIPISHKPCGRSICRSSNIHRSDTCTSTQDYKPSGKTLFAVWNLRKGNRIRHCTIFLVIKFTLAPHVSLIYNLSRTTNISEASCWKAAESVDSKNPKKKGD